MTAHLTLLAMGKLKAVAVVAAAESYPEKANLRTLGARTANMKQLGAKTANLRILGARTAELSHTNT